jgi:hypothetical protein
MKINKFKMKKIILSLFFVSNFVYLYSQDTQKIANEFRQDTIRVEQKVRDMLEKDYSTAGMINSSVVLETEYDKLLNKYYKLLYHKLDKNGKTALEDAQLKWIKFRDADKNLVMELSRNTYDTREAAVFGM